MCESTNQGTSLNRIDEVLAPYVTESYKKHLNDAYEWNIPNSEEYAMAKTEKETYDACQAMEYEINTIHTANGQTPFVTLGFGLGTSWESRLIQKSIFEVRLKGLGKHHRTAIFPKLTFCIKEGVNRSKDDPNYDIKRLALKCMSKRIYPDILNYDEVVRVTGGFKAPMGCVDGEEVITYRIDNVVYCTNFETLWNKVQSLGIETHNSSEYVKTENLEILDINDEFTKVHGVIKNQDKGDWRLVKFSNGRSLVCTGDHPLPVEGKGRTFVDDMEIGDVVKRTTTVSAKRTDMGINKDVAWLHGLMICDAAYVDNIRISLGNDEKDIGNFAIRALYKLYPELSHSYVEQRRGVKGNYLDIVSRGTGVGRRCKMLANLFGGYKKLDRQIPTYVFNSSYETKCAFIAGMIDADGYINSNGVIGIGSTNKTLAIQQSQLFEMIGCKSKVYLNKYSSKHSKYRYKVEVKINSDVLQYMKSSKKQNNFDIVYKDYDDCDCKVVSITDLGYRGKPSYDVTTESDTFVVSGLHSHNCRSFLHEYTDPESGEKVYDGRNNMGVISINLPAIAMQTNDPDKFMQLLDERMELAHKGLEARINRMRGVTADTAPILYMEGAFGKRLKAKDEVIQLFENGRASVSLGYIGVHEMCEVLFPDEPHIYDSTVKKQFAVEVVKRMHDRCEQWKKESGWAYSLYSTPSESLCDRFCRIDSERFDNEKYGYLFEKGYYTNSFHLDVSKKTSPDGKIDFESVFPQYATGGNIVYCELPDMTHFIDALEWVVDYSYDKVPYFGTNMPINYCGACGHAGEVEATEKGFACPECGNHDPETLQVVIRVCGYLGNPEARPFIEGKQKEVMQRITHTGD